MEVPQYTEVMQLSEADEQRLLKIGQAEAGDQNIDGIALVMQVVLNRLKRDGYANTIEGVISQEGQFQSYINGSYFKAVPSEYCYLALDEIEAGTFMSHPIIAFEVAGARTLDKYYMYAFTLGDHDFYTEK